MALPKAIQKQLAEVEQYEQQLAEQTQEEQQLEPSVEETSSDDTEQDAIEAPEVKADSSSSDLQEELRVWRERYNTLQSKYNAEVPRLHDHLKSQTEVIATLQREIEALKANKQDTHEQKKTESLVTEKDEEAFGSDLIDLIRRVVRDEATRNLVPEVDRLVRPIREQLGTVVQSHLTAEQQRFWRELTEAIPNWQQINESKEWLQWLAERETPWATRTRQDALDEAQKMLDYERVINMFKAFLEGKEQNQTKPNLSKKVSPPKTNTAAQIPSGNKIWTNAEYMYAMDPRRKNEMGLEAWMRLVNEAEKALAEGRVKFG